MSDTKTIKTPSAAAPRKLTELQLDVARSLADSNPALAPQAIRIRPTSPYASQERFDLEQSKLFRGRPVPLEMSCALPDRRTHVVVEEHGQSVILSRDDEGVVHAFANVCMHRCVQLSQAKEPKQGALIVCPYHAWSYSLRGELVAVPREDVFPGLDKAGRRLVQLQCQEAGGMIWVNLDHKTQCDFSQVDALARDFDAIGLDRQVIYRRARFDLATNWKLIHDAFLENYHIPRLHAQSLGSMFVDRPTVIRRIGPHLLQSSARVGYKQESGKAVETFEAFRKAGVFSYTIVPGGVVITSPTYINVMLMAPQSPGRTIINYYMLVDRMPETDEEIARCEKSIALMERITTQEDFWAAQLGTIGARTGVVADMVLGGMEQDIALFHEILESEMAR